MNIEAVAEAKRRYGWVIVFGDKTKSPEICGAWKVSSQTDEQFKQLFDRVKDRAFNWGPITGNGLIAFDFDWPWVFGLWWYKFKERADTLIIQTPNGGARVFYHTNEPSPGDPFKETLHLEIKTNHYVAAGGDAEVQGGGMGSYEIQQDKPIKTDDSILRDTIDFLNELLNGKYNWLNYRCIGDYLNKCKKRLVLPHEAGRDIANLMMFHGCEDWEHHNFRKSVWDFKEGKYTPEYDEKKTQKQVESTRRYFEDKQGKPIKCNSLRQHFNASEDTCKGCIRKKPDKEKPDRDKKNYVEMALDELDKHTFKTAEDIEEIYYFRVGNYTKAETFVKGFMESAYGTEISSGTCSEVLGHLKRRSYTDRAEFNKFDGEIPVENGLLNLETGTLRPFTPDRIFTFKIRAKYDPAIRCEVWENFMREVLPDELDRRAAQEYAGYTLLPEMPYHKIGFMVGEGRNGKGVFVRTIQSILGSDSVSNIKIDQLNDTHRFAATGLFGMLMNVSSEPSIRYPLSTELLKQLTGEDMLDGEVKGKQNRVKFQSFAKHFVLANRLPKVNDKSLGWWDRVLLIEWKQIFTDEKGNRVEKIENRWLRDEESRAGILTWMVEGLRRLQSQHRFTQSKTMKEAMIKFKKVSDPIAAFLEEACEYDPEYFESRLALYIAYKDYVRSLNSIVEGDRTFYAALRGAPGVGDDERKIGGKTTRGFSGIRLKDADEMDTHSTLVALPDTPGFGKENKIEEKGESEKMESEKMESGKRESVDHATTALSATDTPPTKSVLKPAAVACGVPVLKEQSHNCECCGMPAHGQYKGKWLCRPCVIREVELDRALGGGSF